MQSPSNKVIESLKVTRYLTRIDIDECNIILLYGGLKGRLVEIDANSHNALVAVLENPDSVIEDNEKKLRDFLLDEGLLVSSTCDELAELKKSNDSARSHEPDHLALTICPTLKCNFRCTYCYQDFDNSVFERNLRESVIDFVAHQLDRKRRLHITWFGGEPLLALPVITQLSQRFIELTKPHGIPYSASMVTNGWLFSQKTSRRLADLGVRKVQITLDGPAELHDQRRRLINGQNTFKRILHNIKNADPRIQINIRINVDLDSSSNVKQLFDTLDASGLRGRVKIYFAPVIAYQGVCSDTTDRCLQNETWSHWQAQLQLEALERGYGTLDLPRTCSHVCMADSNGSIVITPDGLAYKCWSDVSEPSKATLDLMNNRQSVTMRNNEKAWQTWSPFDYEECLHCTVLPQCAGGCPQLSMQNQRGYCKAIRYNLRERILLYYLAFRRREVAVDLRSILERILPESVFSSVKPNTYDT